MDRKGELIIMDLSLNSEVFLALLALRASFDDMLKKVLQNMLEQKNDTAEINVKVKIKLQKSYINVSYEDQREVITPIFQHKVTSMLQVKDEQSGSFNGNNGKYELLWDDEREKYILTEMQIAQTSLF